jgi:hypothetical protein
VRAIGVRGACGVAGVITGPARRRSSAAIGVGQALRALADASDAEWRGCGTVRIRQAIDTSERGIAFLSAGAFVRAVDPA